MADEITWAMDIEDSIFTILMVKLNSALLTEFPDMLVTQSDKYEAMAQFPAVYFHQIGNIESGMDLSQQTINGVMFTAQVDVTVTTSQSDAKRVANEAIVIFKELGFIITNLPIFNNTDSAYRCYFRVRRFIGANDEIGG